MMPTILNNRYSYIQTLGGGGFGETFLAEDTHMPSRRRCVIKQLKPVSNNPQVHQLVQDRFQREAAILEELGEEHPQIPKLYAYFSETGQFYLIQEWIEGVTLGKQVQQQGLLSDDGVKDMLVHLLPVLDFIHTRQIIHRDIKPDNIILRASDGLPVLIDFGAVKEAIGTVVNSQGNTSSIVIGTPGFMPAEQAAGRPLYSSDLYSLGLTAIYLLTGKLPQEFETDPHTGEIIWRSQARHVSPALATVIDRAIMSHPRDRFPTAAAMLEALHTTTTAATPTVAIAPPRRAEPPSPTPQTVAINPQPSSPGNNGKTVILAGLIAGGLIGASVVFGFVLTRTPKTALEQPTAQDSTPSPEASPSPPPVETPPSPAPAPPPETPVAEAPTSSQSADSQPDRAQNFPPTSPPEAPGDRPQTFPPASAPEVPGDRPAPRQALSEYYGLISSGQYSGAWNQLSPSYRSNSRVHPQGYDSYSDWWGQVDRVEVLDSRLVEAGAEVARVDARLRYVMRSGRTSVESVRFKFVWDGAANRWLIDDTKLL